MTSEKITIGSDNTLPAKLANEAEKFTKEAGITGKDALHIRLLTEELDGMLSVMVGDFSGRFWIENTDKECRINIDAIADMDPGKERELLSVSKSGKNAARRGVMSRLGDFFASCLYDYNELAKYGAGADLSGYGYMYSAGITSSTMMSPGAFEWSLAQYSKSIEDEATGENKASEIWDELEKSIVANISDDVIVGVDEERVTMTIVKKLA